ncbi:hypothetical protein [Propionivibrio sp.]|uniref:lipopolysaccharide biosynthesis protein n=1 Tax=Propionivibrio sp. TaxID=2212460 RepID=UPI0025D845CE|nr:hypothetical protein [Propionivibrio sp.]MBK7354677.1 hypothetical protein [Propionivibrio sp.]
MISGTWLAAMSLFLAPIYVHLLGIENYGLIGLYVAALAMGGILDVALSATVTRELAWILARTEERSKIGSLLFSVEVVYWLSVLVLAFLLLVALNLFGVEWVHTSTLSDQQIREALSLMLLSLAIQLPSGLYTASLVGMHKQTHSSVIMACLGTLRGVGAVLVAWGMSDDIRAFFLWYIAVGLLQVAWLRWQTWSCAREFGGYAHFSLQSLSSIKNTAGAMLLITAMGMMLSQMDKIALSFMVSLKSLGYYTLAWGLASGLSILATPVAQGFSARFSALASDSNETELANQVFSASQLMYALVIPPAITISLFAEEIMSVWVRNPSVASASAPSLSLLALGTAMVSSIYPPLNALYAKKQFKSVLAVQLVCLVVFFPLLLFLIGTNGILGAAWSWLIYSVVLYLSYVLLVTKLHGNMGMPTRFFKSFVLVVVTSIAVSWFAKKIIGDASYGPLLIGMIGMVLVAGWLSAVLVCPELRIRLGLMINSYRFRARNF